mmetsp:Transcript_29473/g.75521  ORF Transcript_29473/g.75521 Transcript_29473/m.75521 type:complete len:173 (-) Transcript_29473:170-688(-)
MIQRILQPRAPGQTVLDWGSGCGHMLSWFKMLFDVDGFGVEYTEAASTWSSKYSLGHTCRTDGRNLSFIPDAMFDHVVSEASLLHLASYEELCSTVGQLVRKLRPGGSAFFGWNRPHLVDGEGWRSCLRREGLRLHVETIWDASLFPETEEAAEGIYTFELPAFTVLVTRLL